MATLKRRARTPPTAGAIRSIVLKITARCNLACPYCYMFFHADQAWRTRPAQINAEVLDSVLRSIRSYADEYEQDVSISLHGGEPLLVGVRRFEEIVKKIRYTLGRRLGRISVQSNGVMIDWNWACLFRDLDVSVGISVDGPIHIHDSHRPDWKGQGSFERVMKGICALAKAGKAPGVLAVASLGEDGAAVYQFFRRIGLHDIAFLIPDATHDNYERLYGSFPSLALGKFLIGAFEAWFSEDEPSINLRPMKQLISAMLGGPQETDAFGSPPLSYVIVDTDGSVETIDTLRICGPNVSAAGLNLTSGNLSSLFSRADFVGQLIRSGPGVPDQCAGCREVGVCAGGYLPHRYSESTGFENKSIWCNDILTLFDHIRARLRICEVDVA